MRFISVFIQSLCAAALVSAAPASKSADSVKRPLGSTLWHPTMFNMPQSSSDDSSPAANNIAYKAGTQVLTGDTRVHILYYGKFQSSETAIINDFVSTLNNSTWWSTTRQYYSTPASGKPKTYIKGAITLGSIAADAYSVGTSLSGTNIPDLLDARIDAGDLPEDTNAIYLFASSADVKEAIRDDLGPAAFCQDYCGYHVSWLRGSKRLFYAFIGNPSSCLAGCSPNNQVKSPNGNPGVDAMISVIAHELTEAVTDPISDVDSERAWQDAQGYENADKCAYQYGTMTTFNGFKYNVVQGSRKYLIQQNWSPATPQKCVSSV